MISRVNMWFYSVTLSFSNDPMVPQTFSVSTDFSVLESLLFSGSFSLMQNHGIFSLRAYKQVKMSQINNHWKISSNTSSQLIDHS